MCMTCGKKGSSNHYAPKKMMPKASSKMKMSGGSAKTSSGSYGGFGSPKVRANFAGSRRSY